ncbi:MAG TPA: phosphoribosylanthranilate isomerase [Candidatus Hydrogenedens sp.]|nr:phosphoribosylanthranilate isomerase [Candidatus Hydrogenedens sp.]HOK09841.1 phosphoribosylanthranilate isomerase [Candidatus Hydrogenedens sp.]
MKVKICGITNKDDALMVCDAGADAIGIVMAPEAKARHRYVPFEEAIEILEVIPPFVTTVGVIVNEPMERWVQYLTYFDLIQMCGEEKPEEIPVGQSIIKSFAVDEQFTITNMLSYKVRGYLLDAKIGEAHGGTGKTCNWEKAREAVETGKPIILAGGLNIDNVVNAIQEVRPYAVDVSTGVEEYPGKKDEYLVREFIYRAKNALS